MIDEDDPDGPSNWPAADPSHQITANASGYIETCEYEDLEKICDDRDWRIQVSLTIGAFTTETTTILDVWTGGDLSDDDIAYLRGCVVIGPEPTEHQNPTFLAQQLVEMTIRALSPGINDPYTAIDCLNRLSAALTVAATYNGGLRPVHHPAVRRDHMDFQTLFGFTFPLCRQYVLRDDLTRIHARSLLTALRDMVRSDDMTVIEDELALLDAD